MATKVDNKNEVIDNKADTILVDGNANEESLTPFNDFIERNKTVILSVAGAIALIVGGYIGFKMYNEGQNTKALAEMYNAEYYFESDSLNAALNGDGVNAGFLSIIDNYGSTSAGNVANFYAGAIYLKQGEFDKAIEYLKDYSSSDFLIQARAYSLIGDSYMEKGEFSDAASFYKKAANHNPNKIYTPDYLMKLGLALEKTNNYSDAAQAYGDIIKKYPDTFLISDAKRYRAKAAAQAGIN